MRFHLAMIGEIVCYLIPKSEEQQVALVAQDSCDSGRTPEETKHLNCSQRTVTFSD